MNILPLLLLTCLAIAGQTSTSAKVVRILDGDTIEIELAGKVENVRLIGIDTPESKRNRKVKKDAARSGEDLNAIIGMGKAATEFTKTLVKPGDLVNVEQDVQPRDRYGRILAYVYLKSGEMLNEEIISAGYASVMTIPPDVRYQDRFLAAYRAARVAKRGLWASPHKYGR